MTAQLSLFYNTNNTEGTELRIERTNANNQGEVILSIYRRYKRLSPSEALEIYLSLTQKHSTPITSIRRAITDLAKGGLLLKTDSMRIGVFGKRRCSFSKSHVPRTSFVSAQELVFQVFSRL